MTNIYIPITNPISFSDLLWTIERLLKHFQFSMSNDPWQNSYNEESTANNSGRNIKNLSVKKISNLQASYYDKIYIENHI